MSSIQHLPDFGRQDVRGERLLDEMPLGCQLALLRDDVGRVAGHKEDSDLWPKRDDLPREILAVHLRHQHIGQQQVDLSGVFPGQASASLVEGAARTV